MMRTLEAFCQNVQVAIVAAERFQRLDGRKHVIAIDAGPTMPLSHQVKLPFEGEPSSVLSVPAIDTVNQCPDPSSRRAQNGDGPIGLDVNVRDLLARSQVCDRFIAHLA